MKRRYLNAMAALRCNRTSSQPSSNSPMNHAGTTTPITGRSRAEDTLPCKFFNQVTCAPSATMNRRPPPQNTNMTAILRQTADTAQPRISTSQLLVYKLASSRTLNSRVGSETYLGLKLRSLFRDTSKKTCPSWRQTPAPIKNLQSGSNVIKVLMPVICECS